MSIHDIYKKIKSFWLDVIWPLIFKIRQSFDVKEDTFIVLVIILIGLAGFGLGRLSALEKGREPVTIKPADFITLATTTMPIQPVLPIGAISTGGNTKGMLVASKNGTKYYFPWCAGVSKIKEENKVWFDSYASAQAAGLTAATNCPNLK